MITIELDKGRMCVLPVVQKHLVSKGGGGVELTVTVNVDGSNTAPVRIPMTAIVARKVAQDLLSCAEEVIAEDSNP